MQTIVPPPTDLLVGICVKCEFVFCRGKNSYRAVHKRDFQTKWQVTVPSQFDGSGEEHALAAWMARFTGIDKNSDKDGFNSNFKVVARAGEAGAYYYTLVPDYML